MHMGRSNHMTSWKPCVGRGERGPEKEGDGSERLVCHYVLCSLTLSYFYFHVALNH